MCAVSTSFLAHPRVRNATERGAQGALGLAVAGFLHGSVAFPLRHR